MSRYCGEKIVEPILRAAQHWKDVGLLSDSSIFDRGAIWTLSNFEALNQHVVNQPKEGKKRNFFQKLEGQLELTVPGVKQLAAEMLWLMFLCPSNISVSKKREGIERIWKWSGEAFPEDSEWIKDDVLGGVGSAGTAFNTKRWWELRFFIRTMIAFKSLADQEQNKLLSDGWEFAQWLEQVPECDARQLRHMFLFLLFPDNFERILGRRDRRRIIQSFSGKSLAQVKKLSALEIDRNLLEIRRQKEEEYGTKELDFYATPLRDLWGDSKVVKAAKQPDDKKRNGSVKMAINQILYGPPGTGKTYRLNRLKEEYSGRRQTLSRDAWLIQEMLDAKWFDVIFGTLYDLGGEGKVKAILNHEYVQMKAEALGRGRNIANTIWRTLGEHTRENSSTSRYKRRSAPLVFDKKPNSVWSLVDDWEEECAEQVEQAKKWKTGPKQEASYQRYEYVTFHQAYSYEDFVEGIRPVQNEETENIGYQVLPGVFKRICQRAKADPDQRYAIFIDEINRGNIAKIFGELITLIEEDKRAIYNDAGDLKSGMELTLPYSGMRFGVPENLDVYGTMNTADRSIALLDTALRRRFQFEELMPDAGVIVGSRGDGCIEDGGGGVINLRALLEAMNRRIRFLLNRDMMIGHAYFIDVRNFDDLKVVLFNKIIPLLQEYFYENWHRIQLVFRDVGPTGEKLEPQIVCHDTLNEVEVLGFDHDDFDDLTEYWVVDSDEITPDAVRKVYEEGA